LLEDGRLATLPGSQQEELDDAIILLLPLASRDTAEGRKFEVSSRACAVAPVEDLYRCQHCASPLVWKVRNPS
jgi:hypothetical protein